MEWFEANAGWLWFAAAVVLAGVELLTLDLVLVMLAAGAAAAGAAALAGAGVGVQVAVFAAASLLMLAAVRPVALRHLRKDTGASASYLDGLVGRRLTTDSPVTEDSGVLTVDGETWSARIEPGARPAAPGQEVTVLEVAGAHLVVRAAPVIDWDAPRP